MTLGVEIKPQGQPQVRTDFFFFHHYSLGQVLAGQVTLKQGSCGPCSQGHDGACEDPAECAK